MRMSCSIIIASALLLPLQAVAQSGSVGGSGSGTGGVTSGTAGGNSGTVGTGSGATPGTNSLGTAQSSGRGAASGSASANTSEDKKIEDENRQIDQKLKGICRGC
jgi:hypothetical protein